MSNNRKLDELLSDKASPTQRKNSRKMIIIHCDYAYPRTYKGRGRGRGKGKLSFFLEDKTSAPDVFSSCSFIPRAHFETSS